MITNLLTILLSMGNPEGESDPLMQMLPLLLIFVVVYMFFMRPQLKKQKEVKKYRENLQKGDKVVTVGGIYGKIADISETAITLDVGNNIRLKVDKNGILKDSTDLASK